MFQSDFESDKNDLTMSKSQLKMPIVSLIQQLCILQ